MRQLACFLSALCALYIASDAFAQSTALDDETQSIRALINKEEGFADRMRAYAQLSAPLESFAELLDSAAPLLRELGEMSESLGLFTMLLELDPSTSSAHAVMKTLTQLDNVEDLKQTAKQLQVLGADIERLSRAQNLDWDELGALRATLPKGREAITKVLEVYQDFAPMVKELSEGLGSVERELLSSLLGSDLFGLPPELSNTLHAFIGTFFADIHRSVELLETLGQYQATDLEQLTLLEQALLEAEAHLAHDQAIALLDSGRLEDARAAIDLLSQNYPQSPWSSRAQTRLQEALTQTTKVLDESPEASLEAPSAFPWTLFLLGLAAAATLGAAVAIVWTRHRAARQKVETPAPTKVGPAARRRRP
ncbi:MAG: hypothetical protein RBU37_04220 [Myxococcota bacterium]|jgi:TolA-binding protein|nr:hypothetical protein [Myxococcota bacterium]